MNAFKIRALNLYLAFPFLSDRRKAPRKEKQSVRALRGAFGRAVISVQRGKAKSARS
jgi:hypothetical protein